MCPTVQLIGDNQRTAGFRRFRLVAGGGCLLQWPLSRGLVRRLAVEIGFGPWIAVELVMCPAAQLVSGVREPRIPLFPAGCGLRAFAVVALSWTGLGIRR